MPIGETLPEGLTAAFAATALLGAAVGGGCVAALGGARSCCASEDSQSLAGADGHAVGFDLGAGNVSTAAVRNGSSQSERSGEDAPRRLRKAETVRADVLLPRPEPHTRFVALNYENWAHNVFTIRDPCTMLTGAAAPHKPYHPRAGGVL
eukprot:SAG11_NODE_92_length_17132_cov_10.277285_7_plen_150_part_00